MEKMKTRSRSRSSRDEEPTRVVILGAGGRDFHNFNTYCRNRRSCQVLAFTATQIPYIENRIYPPELAGPLYPKGIPIYLEETLPRLIKEVLVQQVIFSYSDVSHEELMDKASLALSLGADFLLLGPGETMIQGRVPIISVCAVRTGCGKSAITRRVASILKKKEIKVSVIRHPMAYCNFEPFQRFSNMEEVEKGTCTIEEKEEFEPLVEMGMTVYAGTDYEQVLREAEKESEMIIWDGGNNDFPFIKPDWEIVLVDALRPSHEKLYYPGEVNFRRADLLIITKVNDGTEQGLKEIRRNISLMNPEAVVLEAPSITRLDDPDRVRNRKVLVIEDGPSITHGGLPFGAGASALRGVAADLVDPRPYAVGSLKEVYKKYPHIGHVLPAMGYSEEQVKDLEETVHLTPCDAVVIATPADLRQEFKIDQPVVRVFYDFEVDLEPLVNEFIEKKRASAGKAGVR